MTERSSGIKRARAAMRTGEIMDLKRQASAPLYEAIEKFRKKELFRLMFRDIREEGQPRTGRFTWRKMCWNRC